MNKTNSYLINNVKKLFLMHCVQKGKTWEERLEADPWEKMGEGLERLMVQFAHLSMVLNKIQTNRDNCFIVSSLRTVYRDILRLKAEKKSILWKIKTSWQLRNVEYCFVGNIE